MKPKVKKTAMQEECSHPAIADTKFKVVSISDYYARVSTLPEWIKAALVLIYSENTIVDKVEIKGEMMFVCKL